MDKSEIDKLPVDTVGQRIKKFRLSEGLTQEKISEKLGFSANYYGQVERGAKGLSKNMANAFCENFGLTYSYLYHGLSPEEIEREASSDNSKNRVVAFFRACSEEECALLYPILLSMIHSRRKTWTLAERQKTMKRAGRPRKNWTDGNGRD